MASPISTNDDWKKRRRQEKEIYKQSPEYQKFINRITICLFALGFLLIGALFIWSKINNHLLQTGDVEYLINAAKERRRSFERVLEIEELNKRMDIANEYNQRLFNEFKTFMNDKSWEVREISIVSINRFDTDRKIGIFIDALQDVNLNVQIKAVTFLGKLREDASPQTIAALISILNDHNQEGLHLVSRDTKFYEVRGHEVLRSCPRVFGKVLA